MELDQMLEILATQDGSDLYLATGAPPCAKFQGVLKTLTETPLAPGEVARIANSIMDEEQRQAFERDLEMNLALSLHKVGRFRVNIFKQRNEVSIVARNIKLDIPLFKDLFLPPILLDVVMEKRGLVLFVGGTGSGKSTSLAALIDHRNRNSSGHIITIEDPIEYIHTHRKSIINQREVGVDTRSFHAALKNTLRQAPDVILIGEIRDHETAEMALRAAMTGHQVHATLHTQSAIGAIARLQNLGIAPEMLAGNLTGIIAQRLVRKLCQHCREAIPVDAHARQVLGLPLQASPQLYRARGCQHCNHSGYRGRFAIMESLLLNPELDALLANRASVAHLLQAAKNQGFRSLIDDARHRIMQGDTSLEEAARVIDLTAGAC